MERVDDEGFYFAAADANPQGERLMRWALAWVMWGAGEAVYWFDMETSVGSRLWQWTQWPIHRLEAFLTEGSQRVQGNGAGPWIGTYRAPVPGCPDDECPF